MGDNGSPVRLSRFGVGWHLLSEIKYRNAASFRARQSARMTLPIHKIPNGRYFGNEKCDCSPVCQEPLFPETRYSPTLILEGQMPAFTCPSQVRYLLWKLYAVFDGDG